MQKRREILLTAEEAGDLLGAGPSLPRRLAAEGLLDHVRDGNKVLIPYDALLAYAVRVAGHPANAPVQQPVFGSEPALYRVSDVTRILSLSRSVVFDLIRSGRLKSVKQGRTRLVPASAVREYVALLQREVA